MTSSIQYKKLKPKNALDIATGTADIAINLGSISNCEVIGVDISEQMLNVGREKITKMKSSYKFCVIASGEYDLYVADPRASEWDIAAGDAILRNAGGSVKDMNGNEILYGKKDFKNPSLVIKSARLLYNEWTN